MTETIGLSVISVIFSVHEMHESVVFGHSVFTLIELSESL